LGEEKVRAGPREKKGEILEMTNQSFSMASTYRRRRIEVERKGRNIYIYIYIYIY